MTRKTKARGIAAVTAVLFLAACGSQPSDDRPDKAADGYKDTSKVTIWRNADQVPNIALFCADGLRFAATLSADGSKQPVLIRVPERDDVCSR